MNASVVIVIVNNEKNISLSWPTNDYPPVLLTDELFRTDNQTHGECNYFGRVIIPGKPPQVVIGGRIYTTLS